MALYYYSKYLINRSDPNMSNWYWEDRGTSSEQNTITGYSSVKVVDGRFVGVGSVTLTPTSAQYGTAYKINADNTVDKFYKPYTSAPGETWLNITISRSRLSGIPSGVWQGDFVGTVTAELSMYPTNGAYTDGFWYIRGSIVATAPTTPGVFTAPTGALEIGDSRAISWGASSDAENNLARYVLEASINNGGWVQIGQPTSLSFTYTVPTATTVKFRVKAVDSGGLQSGYRESALFNVTKPMYYWSKHNVSKLYTEANWTAPQETFFIGTNPHPTAPNGIRWDVSGYVSIAPVQQVLGYSFTPGMLVFGGNPDGGRYPVVYEIEKYLKDGDGLTHYRVRSKVRNATDAQGTLIQANITAVEDTYPTNGKHTDGFWYVRGSRVSQSIAPPAGFTTPAPGAILLPGKAVTLAFGASTAPSISTYEVQQRYNEGAWVNVGTHTNALTRAFTTSTDKANQTVEFRVRVKNTSNVYSDYIQSEAFVIQHNVAPTMTLSTTDNRTLYENDTYGIVGSATDTDNGDVITVMYQINGGTKRAIATQISSGSAIPFNLSLTFKSGMLYNGETAVTPVLAEGTQHTLKVWAEDNQGGTPAEQMRTFYVVPNRPASLTINPFPSATDLINTDLITISGSVSDPDNNTVTVIYKIANGSYTEVYSGSGGSFSFQLSLTDLTIGANTVTIQATDTYGAVTSKTLQITKAENVQPLKTAVTRYKLTPPNGTAKGVLLWIEREVGDLVVDAEISMGMSGEAENFVPMSKKGTAFVSEGIEEDEFLFDADSAKENIVLKLTMTRSSTASDKGITLISGVLS